MSSLILIKDSISLILVSEFMVKAGNGTGKRQSLEFVLIPQVTVNQCWKHIVYHGAVHD